VIGIGYTHVKEQKHEFGIYVAAGIAFSILRPYMDHVSSSIIILKMTSGILCHVVS
jgi:hypothetical protein